MGFSPGSAAKDAPTIYGPPKTLYNRNVRWAAKGVWRAAFEAPASLEFSRALAVATKGLARRRVAECILAPRKMPAREVE